MCSRGCTIVCFNNVRLAYDRLQVGPFEMRHPHDHILAVDVCTRYAELLRFWSSSFPTLVFDIANPSISAMTKRKFDDVRCTNGRFQICRPNAPPPRPYLQFVELLRFWSIWFSILDFDNAFLSCSARTIRKPTACGSPMIGSNLASQMSR